MPEYSSTTITPSDGVQVPGMNGSTSGNFLLSALRDFILASKGQANGLASLGSDGKLTASQLPDLADDVIVVASYATLPAIGTAGKIYITADNNKMYRWDSDLATPDYVELSVDLSAYATKAELAAEESARESEDSNLKSAIQGNTARIENLEQEHGGYYDVDVKSVYTVPSGKAKNWAVNVLRGVSRTRNQLVGAGNATTLATYNDGIFTINSTIDSTRRAIKTIPMTSGHKYLLCYTIKSGSLTDILRLYSSGYVDSFFGSVSKAWLFDCTTTGNYDINAVISESTAINVSFTMTVTDLTQYFNGSIPSDADTIAKIQTNYPELLVLSDYDTGTIVNTSYEGVKSVGVNIWDEEYLGGKGLKTSDGTVVDSTDRITCADYIPVKPSTWYYFKFDSVASEEAICWYDANKTYISGAWNTAFNNKEQSPSNAYFMKFTRYPSTSYTSGIQISEVPTGTPTTINTTYHPHMSDALTLPTPVTLKSAGAVHEEYDLETGEKTNPLGIEDLSELEWTYVSSDGGYYSATLPNTINANPNMLCENYSIDNVAVFNMGDKTMRTIPNGIYVKDSSGTPTGTLIYALATPDEPTQLTTVIDNFLPTESGGTISSILTDPVDDNMNLGYLNL